MSEKQIKASIIKSGFINWKGLEFLQDESFKSTDVNRLEKLKRSIKQHGFIQPFFVWEDKKGKVWCIDGFHRKVDLELLQKEGYHIPDKLPAVYIDCKNKKDAAKKVLLYSSQYSGITDEGLYKFSHNFGIDFNDIKLEIDIPSLDLDMYEAGYVGSGQMGAEGDETEAGDEIPETPKKAKSKLGQIYLLGGVHRLLCGDCENKEYMEALFNGAKMELVLTDPPYGINVVNVKTSQIGGGGETHFGQVGGGNWVPANKYMPIIGDDKPFNPAHLLDLSDRLIIWGGNHFASKLPDTRGWIIWDKKPEGAARNTFADCEIAWTSFDMPARIYRCIWQGLLKEGEQGVSREHPTQKPLKLFKELLEEYSKQGDSVFDGYGGSGTTLIACEQTERACYMTEIEPLYIDVILERYKRLTGKEAELIEEI